MADWFKFYENDLAEERLRWAMGEQQQVAIVYVTIMSRCCRDHSPSIPWKGKDFELFALAQQCFISPPVANQCLGLLQEIEYIEIKDGLLTVVAWSFRQSEYCQKKAARRDSIPTLSRHCPDIVGLEERRGDKKRGQETSLEVSAECPGMEGNSFELLKQSLNRMYSRRPDDPWGNGDEHILVEVSRRLNVMEEFSELSKFKPSGGKYFPQSAGKLLERWTDTLDRARNPANKPNPYAI